MANVVRELITKLTLKTNSKEEVAKFNKAVDGALKTVGVFTGVVTTASVATFAFVAKMTASVDAIGVLATEVGLSNKRFQEMTFIADRASVPIVNLVKGLQNLQRNLGMSAKAAAGGKKDSFANALNEIGLSLADLEGLQPEEIIGKMGDSLFELDDANRRVRLSQILLGEAAGPKMLSLLEEGSEGIAAYREEIAELGIVLSDDAIEASGEFQTKLSTLGMVITNISQRIAVKMIPTISKGVDGFQKWLIANKKLLQQRFETFVSRLAEAFSSLLDNAPAIFDAFETMLVVFEAAVKWTLALIDAMGGLDIAIGVAAVAWAAYAIAQGAALAPVLAVTAVILGLAAAFGLVAREADEARKAEDKFGKTKPGSKKLNKQLASSDARAIAEAFGRGEVPSDVFIDRLVKRSPKQIDATLRAARSTLVKKSELAGGGRFSKTGQLVSAGISDLEAEGAVRALNELEKIISDRLIVAGAPSLDVESETDFVDRLIRDSSLLNAGFSDRPTGGGGTSAGSAPDGPTPEELIAQAIASGSDIDPAALLNSTTPPIIVMIQNVQVDMQVEAPVTFNGAPGEGVSLEEVGETARDVFQTELTDAMEQLRPQLAR